jgi:hypothetical protein
MKTTTQNEVALSSIESSLIVDRRIRLEPEAKIDIIDQLDLTSTELDLERLVQELVIENTKKAALP